MKPQSVRSQRSVQDHMATLYQGIDNLVYAAQISCARDCADNDWECSGYDCPFRTNQRDWCKLKSIRGIVGEHFQQSDIETVEVTK